MRHGYYLSRAGQLDLRLKGAMLRPHPTNRDWVLAQFDTLTHRLSHTWATFPRRDFRERLRNPEEQST